MRRKRKKAKCENQISFKNKKMEEKVDENKI
jgi:hypothetical protein